MGLLRGRSAARRLVGAAARSVKVLAREYRLTLPDEKILAEEIEKTRRTLEARGIDRRGLRE